MVEQVDTLGLEPSALRGGSNPSIGIKPFWCRIGNAAVLKTVVRKGMGVRIPQMAFIPH